MAVVISLACALTIFAPVRAPERDEAPQSNISELFDPLALARNMCGRTSGLDWFGAPDAQAAAVEPEAAITPAPRSPRIDGLGSLTYKISTASAEAQAFFDQGLKLVYAFNPGEAVASFRTASDHDPNCAMCFWGEALALGPNLNGPMRDAAIPEALAAVAKAQALASGASAREQALIGAIAKRYSADKAVKREDLDIAFADAMAKVHAAYKDDHDIASLYADAAMEVRSKPFSPWWDRAGQYPSGYVASAIKAIESVLARDPNHPGAIHLYIHALDASASVEKVEPFADKLAKLMPGAGHMIHMPAHTFFNLGRYKDALSTNVAAIAVDDAYLAAPAAANNIYRFGLYPHNIDFALAAAQRAGDTAAAASLTEKMRKYLSQKIPPQYDRNYEADVIHSVVRTGSPDEMLALPKPAAKSPYLVGIWRYARGSAYAYKGDTRRALAEADAIAALRSSRNEKAFGNFYEMRANVLGVAEHVVRARAAVAKGNWPEAVSAFEKAATLQDEVLFKDPPPWVFPVRQALGVALWRVGKVQQATEALRHALFEAPDSGYALYALKELSATQGDELAAAEYGKLFDKAWVGVSPPDLNRL